MEEVIYLNTLVQRGSRYFIKIVRRDAAHYVTTSLDTEQFREQLIPDMETVDKENFSAAVVFKEIVDDEERWIEDNR